MSQCMHRRALLQGAVGAAAAVAARPLTTVLASERRSAPPLPDRAAQAPTAPVAIERCASYEPAVVRAALDAAVARLGGLQKLVQNKTVTVKVNLTGPVRKMADRPAGETYHIHASFVGALCAALHEAGARRIGIVEALYYKQPVEEVLKLAGWDLAAIRAAGGHKVVFENTKNRGSARDYCRLTVPWGGYLFPAFDVNAWYAKTDVFITLAKLKQHSAAGVTMACKNSFGILPTALYGDDAPNEDSVQARVGPLHDAKRGLPAGVPAEIERGIARHQFVRVPRVTADVVGTRPIDLCLIDGVRSISGGEGFWNAGTAALAPKLLLLGTNPVCTDAICTQVMGFDPQAADAQFPFQGENHLRLLAQAGVGTNDPQKIPVVGLPVREAIVPYAPGKTSHCEGLRSTLAGTCPATLQRWA